MRTSSSPSSGAASGATSIWPGICPTFATSTMDASTSSVFGANTALPYAETDKADLQMSFYAATKKAVEGLAHSYAHLWGLPVTLFRFFTVYGAWGRPDLAYFKFASAILKGEPIEVYNHGDLWRDFTAVEDLAQGLALAAPHPAAAGETFNLTFGQGRSLAELVDVVTRASGALRVVRSGDEAGDRPRRGALDIGKARRLLGYAPTVRLEEGVASYLAELRGELGLDAGQKVLRTSA